MEYNCERYCKAPSVAFSGSMRSSINQSLCKPKYLPVPDINCHNPTALAEDVTRGLSPDSMMDKYLSSSGKLYSFNFFSNKGKYKSLLRSTIFVYSRSRTVKYSINPCTLLL